MTRTANKGFITDVIGNYLLPITRGELVLDASGNIALFSDSFAAVAPDATNGKPGHAGLMTAAEKAMLTGTSGLGLGDIYEKLGYINAGLKVGNTVLNFYDNSNTATPISFAPASAAPINITYTADSNTINFGLNEVTVTETDKTGRVSEVTVDRYGRVSKVTYAAIDNSELPASLSEKTLDNAVVGIVRKKNDSTDDYADDAIVPKSYIDELINAAKNIALGALTFKGSIASTTDAESVISPTNVQNNVNNYYKVISGFTFSGEYFHDYNSDDSVLLKAGDTLIVHHKAGEANPKFVLIPSGDDDAITSITINETTKTQGTGGEIITRIDPVIENVVGSVAVTFSDLFTVNASGLLGVSIAIPQVSVNADGQSGVNGYLSWGDYQRFLAASAKNILYQNSLSTGGNLYDIGTFKGVEGATTIIGKDTVSSLSLTETEGSNNVKYPTLTLSYNDARVANKIAIIGKSGITVNKDSNNNISIISNNTVNTEDNSSNYLTIDDNHIFSIKKGYYDSATDVVTEGITSYREFREFEVESVKAHAAATRFQTIQGSLSTANALNQDKTYNYGNDALKAAINVVI